MRTELRADLLRKTMAQFISASAAIFACVVLSGCLPQDRIRALRYSPDARHIAYISDKKGLCVVEPATGTSRVLVRNNVQGDVLSWSPSGEMIACVTSTNSSWEISLAGLDGQTTQITRGLARQSAPQFGADDRLYYLSSETGKNEIVAYNVDDGASSVALSLPADVLPSFSINQRNEIAFASCENLRLQLYVADLATGKVDAVTSEADPLAIAASALAWNDAGSQVLYVRERAPAQRDSRRGKPVAERTSQAPGRPSQLNLLNVEDVAHPTDVAIAKVPGLIDSWAWSANAAAYISNGEITFKMPGSAKGKVARLEGLTMSTLQSAPAADERAFVIEDQLVGTLKAGSLIPHILTFDLQDKFLLAEQYFRVGSTAKSYAIYEELKASVERTQNPALAQFIYAANLQRLGRTKEAVQALEKIASSKQAPAGVPRQYLWRTLGFSYLLRLGDYERARDCFEKYETIVAREQTISGAKSEKRPKLPGSKPQSKRPRGPSEPAVLTNLPDVALNTLAILRRADSELTAKFAQAIESRLNGSVRQTDLRFGQLLQMAPDFAPVQSEYLRASEGYDRQVYFFSPSERPFEPNASQRARYLDRFLKLAPFSPLADETRLKLFLLYVETGDYEEARKLLTRELSTEASDSETLDGIAEVFGNYLETPESQPWLEPAMGGVFLHASLRPQLEQRIDSLPTRMLIRLAAAKLALVQQRNDDARQELDGALALWQQIPAADKSQTMNRTFGRLLIMRAREAELRHLFAEAIGYYDQARKHFEDTHTDEFELFAEVRYRVSFLRYALAHNPDLAESQAEIEKTCGDELVNPTWDEPRLRTALKEQIATYDKSIEPETSETRAIIAYESAMLFRKLGRTWQARAALRECGAETVPTFLREKSLIELAALDEENNDCWNASKSLVQVAAQMSSTDYLRPWLDCQAARLHLRLNYRRAASREALAQIVNTRPGTPLAIQAEELLASTGK